MTLGQLLSKKALAGGREFRILAIRFANGFFLSVAEGDEVRIGSIVLSLRSGNTTTMTSARYGELFSRIMAEMVANIAQGIAIVSLYLTTEPDSQIMKILLEEVRSLIKG